MGFTVAQVHTLVARVDARLSALEAKVDALAPAAVSAPASAQAAAPVAMPERAVKAPHFACSAHAEHKGGKGFTANGRVAHATWCAGTWSTIAE